MLKVSIMLLCMFFWTPLLQAGELENTFTQAQQAFKSGQYNEAGALFTKVADILVKQKNTKASYPILNNAAICYMKAENYPAAINIYTRLLKSSKSLDEKTRSAAFLNLAQCYNKTEQFALRADIIEKAIAAYPNMPKDKLANSYAQLADSYRKIEAYHQAITSFKKAISLVDKKKNPDVLGRLLTGYGLVAGNIGDFATAEKNLQQANGIAQKNKSFQTVIESNSNLGVLYLERGDYAQAQELLNKALTLAQEHNFKVNEGADQNNMGLLLKNAGKYKDAMLRFTIAIDIGQELGSKKDEAIGLVNRALLYRMTAHLQEARADYRKAEGLFREIDFKEGIAGALLGQGYIAQHVDRDLPAALDLYTQALTIYTNLGLLRAQAETYIQLGNVYKVSATPNRSTRDLVFDDAPQTLEISSNDAVKQAKDAYGKALILAEKLSSKELLWSAWQGLGYCAAQEGNIEQAYTYYMQAIDLVTRLRASLASVSLLGEYMAKKENLYGEAREISAALFDKTKDKKYLEKQIQLDETLRNEIVKASVALVQTKFDNPQKQAAYNYLVALGKQQEKAEKSIPIVAAVTKETTAEEKISIAIRQKEAKQQKELVKKLDGEYAKLLAAWEKQYPEDGLIFQSASRVDIAKIQKNLTQEQAVLQYLPLHEKLIIIAISKDAVEQYSVAISQKDLDNIIKKDFLVNYIESYGRAKHKGTEQEEFEKICATLNKLYKYLIEPVETFIADKKKLYFVASGFLAQVPFVALPKNYNDTSAEFLVEKYDISQVRPSFIESLSSPVNKESIKTLLAVGNPRNINIFMNDLKGAETEVKNADISINHDTAIKDIRYKKDATEPWIIEQLKNSQYEYIYFATHAMPFSDTYMMLINNYDKNLAKYKKRFEHKPSANPLERPNSYEWLSLSRKYIDAQLSGYSPVNGYLYLQAGKKFDFTKASSLPSHEDGLLTISDIMRLDKKSFEKTKVVVLSACNTGVTFVPKSVTNEPLSDVLSAEEVEKKLRDTGWVPGVDQVSFVDVFMRRGVSNVYGTLWFADDKSSSYIMSQFMQNMQNSGSASDVVHVYSQTLREFIQRCKENNKPISYDMPLHPYFWAVGSFFGK